MVLWSMLWHIHGNPDRSAGWRTLPLGVTLIGMLSPSTIAWQEDLTRLESWKMWAFKTSVGCSCSVLRDTTESYIPKFSWAVLIGAFQPTGRTELPWVLNTAHEYLKIELRSLAMCTCLWAHCSAVGSFGARTAFSSGLLSLYLDQIQHRLTWTDC